MELNWPLAVLVFAIFFVVLYRKEVGSLLSNVKGINRDGVLFEPLVHSQKDDKKNRIDELSNVGAYELIKILETKIIDELKKDALFHENDTTKILLKHLALTQMQLEFERIYRLIFGSQILFLKRLNENIGFGLRENYIDKFFLEVQEKNDDFQDWSIDEYFSFLFSRELIRKDGDVYQITIKGRDFLAYLVAAGFKEDKLF